MNRGKVRFASLPAVFGLTIAALLGLIGETRGAGADSGEVRFATVEINVAEKGRAISGLTKDDFQLLVDGKPQPILSFEAVDPENRPGAGGLKRGKVVFILFDAHAMGASNAQIAQVAAEKYVLHHVHPQDLVAVGVYGRKLDILQGFTNNVERLVGAIRRPMTTFGETRMEAGFRGNEGLQIAKNAIRTLSSLCDDLAQLDGRKSVLVFSQDFWSPAGDEYSRLVETARKTKVNFYTLITTAASAKVEPDDHDAEAKPSRASNEEKTSTGDGSPRLLTGLSSTSGGLGSVVMGFQQSGVGEPQHPTGPTGGIADSSTRDSATAMDRTSGNADVLQALAKETNGDAVRESNDLNKALDEFDESIGSYYILGFMVSGKSDRHKIEVKTSRKGVRLTYAKQYYPSGNQNLSETAATRTLAVALQSSTQAGPLDIQLQPVVFYRTGQLADVICYLKLKQGQLKLNKKEGDSADHVTVMATAAKEDGTIAGRYEALQEIDLSKNQPLHAQMTLPAGKYVIRVGVADDAGQTGVAQKPVEFAELPAGKLGSSSLIVSAQLSPLPDLIRNAPSQLVARDHPLVFKGYEVTGPVENRANRAKPLALYFNLYNLPDMARVTELVSDARFTDETGQTTLLAPVKHIKTAEPVGPDRVALGFTVPVSNLHPGKYRVTVYTRDADNKNSASCEADVVLE